MDRLRGGLTTNLVGVTVIPGMTTAFEGYLDDYPSFCSSSRTHIIHDTTRSSTLAHTKKHHDEYSSHCISPRSIREHPQSLPYHSNLQTPSTHHQDGSTIISSLPDTPRPYQYSVFIECKNGKSTVAADIKFKLKPNSFLNT